MVLYTYMLCKTAPMAYMLEMELYYDRFVNSGNIRVAISNCSVPDRKVIRGKIILIS